LVINVPATAPAADNDVWHIRVSRDANSSVVLDDMPGDARLIGVVIETQAAPPRTLEMPCLFFLFKETRSPGGLPPSLCRPWEFFGESNRCARVENGLEDTV